MPYGLAKRTTYRSKGSSFNPSYGLHALRAHPLNQLPNLTGSFNPSYGLHALRAGTMDVVLERKYDVSIPHMGCMPYGRGGSTQILLRLRVSIPHMGCMPYGPFKTATDRETIDVSIPHMGCMPYGPPAAGASVRRRIGFNPSYGLHALRAWEC